MSTPAAGGAPELLVSTEGAVRTLTLNRPQAANAIRPEQRNAIIAALADADDDPEVRVVVLRAEGRHFCSGADVGGISKQSSDRHTGDGMRILLRGAQRLIAAVLDCGKPVIASVQGPAAGMGAHLAFACDLVVAAEEASFVEAFVLRGLVLDAAGGYLLPRRIGLQRAKELALLGDKLPATQARELGLVNRVVPAAELAAATAELAGRLAAGPTSAYALTKRLLNASLDQDRASAFLAEAMAQEIQTGAHDSGEGVRAFLERRPPQYKGW
ncbi:MAG TPA: enoyl-CoA hydratase-related protein [Mycobacteriales bacterium]|nr:enoyl-CoA hydratase-related protein [Mycobacteriales bacterium]